MRDTTGNESDTFDAFWDAYPRRVGKRNAHRAWQQATRRVPASEIIAAAQALADDPNLPEKQYIPHPATWLNRDGWDDEPLPARSPQPATRGTTPQRPHGGVYGSRPEDWLASATPTAPTGQVTTGWPKTAPGGPLTAKQAMPGIGLPPALFNAGNTPRSDQ